MVGIDCLPAILKPLRSGCPVVQHASVSKTLRLQGASSSSAVGVGIGLSKSGTRGHIVRRLAAGLPAAECGLISLQVDMDGMVQYFHYCMDSASNLCTSSALFEPAAKLSDVQ